MRKIRAWLFMRLGEVQDLQLVVGGSHLSDAISKASDCSVHPIVIHTAADAIKEGVKRTSSECLVAGTTAFEVVTCQT